MAHVVHEIFAAFKGATGLANATGLPMKTVFEWNRKHRAPSIPPWRRPAVLAAAQRDRKELSAAALAYLASDERTPALLEAA
jgi:hypothetical protein